MRRSMVLAVAWCLILLPGGEGLATTLDELDSRVAQATTVVGDLPDMPDARIPRELFHRCHGVVIFPHVLKLGLVVGVTYGEGIALRRDDKTGQWSKPAFVSIQGGSLGLQVGAQSTDLILLIMSEEAFQRLLEERFTLGADVSVAAGPIGRALSAETDPTFSSGILSYSRSKGAFAGISIKGASVQPDSQANQLYHGSGVSIQDVFYEGAGSATESGSRLIKALQERDR